MLGVVLGWGLLIGGCAAPAPVASKTQAESKAHLVVINLTDYEWHIAVARPSGESMADFHLKPRASSSVDFAAGDCVIDQTALAEGAAPELSRKIPMKLEAGQTYRWRLVTLLSEPIGNSDLR